MKTIVVVGGGLLLLGLDRLVNVYLLNDHLTDLGLRSLLGHVFTLAGILLLFTAILVRGRARGL